VSPRLRHNSGRRNYPVLIGKANAGDATSQRLVAEAYKEVEASRRIIQRLTFGIARQRGGDAEANSVGFLYWVNYKIQGMPKMAFRRVVASKSR